jgi:hypothetical protein
LNAAGLSHFLDVKGGFKFFDPSSIFAVPVHILDGYLILLGRQQAVGSNPAREELLNLQALSTSPTKDPSTSDIELRFQAIVNGNVLDVCFGKVLLCVNRQ